MVNIVVLSNSVGVPLTVPVAVSKDRPAGILGLIVQDMISPAPLIVGSSGRSLLTVLLVRLKSTDW